MKTIVVYKSKTGFTRKYAKWIQETIQCHIINCDNISKSSLSTYDLVIYGSRIHAGKVDGLKKIKSLLVNNEIPHFYMPAGLNYENMGLGDKLIMKALAKMLGNKNDKDSVEAGCEQAIGHSYDISSREYITLLLEFLKILAGI